MERMARFSLTPSLFPHVGELGYIRCALLEVLLLRHLCGHWPSCP